MRAADSLGNRVENRGDWPQFRGPVDTKFPSFDVAASYRGSGSAAQTIYSADVRDYNLTTENYDFICALDASQLRYNSDAFDLGLSDRLSNQLAGIVAQCTGRLPDQPGGRQRLRHGRPLRRGRAAPGAWPTSAPPTTGSSPGAACPTPSSGPT